MIVAGAGIAGLCYAYELMKMGQEVVVLEAQADMVELFYLFMTDWLAASMLIMVPEISQNRDMKITGNI